MKKIVESWLINKGFCIASNKNDNANGFDIVAIKNNEYFTIEVKKACLSTRCFKITPLQKSGKHADYIAIVTPKNNIIFQTINEHVNMCCKTGSRDVTKLVRIYDI